MGRMYLSVSEEIEKKFRRKANEKFGFRKGALGKALEEAVKQWLKTQESE